MIYFPLFTVTFHEDILWRKFYLFEFKFFQQLWKFQAIIQKVIHAVVHFFDCVIVWWNWVVIYKFFFFFNFLIVIYKLFRIECNEVCDLWSSQLVFHYL